MAALDGRWCTNQATRYGLLSHLQEGCHGVGTLENKWNRNWCDAVWVAKGWTQMDITRLSVVKVFECVYVCLLCVCVHGRISGMWKNGHFPSRFTEGGSERKPEKIKVSSMPQTDGHSSLVFCLLLILVTFFSFSPPNHSDWVPPDGNYYYLSVPVLHKVWC